MCSCDWEGNPDRDERTRQRVDAEQHTRSIWKHRGGFAHGHMVPLEPC